LSKFLYFFIFIVPLAIVAFYPMNIIVISDGENSYEFNLGEDGINITIFYIHSVERSPVYEVLHVNKTGIYAVEMRWKDFGAGLPEDFQYIENGFYVKKINIYLGKSLSYWFIPINQAQITINGETIFNPEKDTLITFKVENTTLIKAV